MARFQILNKQSPEKFFIFSQNGEASAVLPAGEPVNFAMDGVNDGFDVELATTGAAVKSTTLFAGIPILEIASKGKGMIQVFGFNSALIYVHKTRAASTDTWASYPDLAIGDKLVVMTVASGFSGFAAGAASDFLAAFVACETKASATTLASSIGSLLRLTSSIKAFVRAM